MKRLIITIIIAMMFAAFIACGSDSITPPAIFPPEPNPAASVEYSFLVFDSVGAGFSNGITYSHFMNGTITPVAPGLFAVDDMLYGVNAFGNTVSTTQLPASPSAVALQGADIWTFETIPPAYAAAKDRGLEPG